MNWTENGFLAITRKQGKLPLIKTPKIHMDTKTFLQLLVRQLVVELHKAITIQKRKEVFLTLCAAICIDNNITY